MPELRNVAFSSRDCHARGTRPFVVTPVPSYASDCTILAGRPAGRPAEAQLLVAISGRPEVMEISAVQKKFPSYSYSYPELFSSDILSRSFGAAASLVSTFIRFVARVEIPLCSFPCATGNLPLSETGSCCTVSSEIRSSGFLLKICR